MLEQTRYLQRYGQIKKANELRISKGRKPHPQSVQTMQEIEDKIDHIRPESHRLLLRYKFIELLTYEEMGKLLNKSPETIYRSTNRALHKITVPEEVRK